MGFQDKENRMNRIQNSSAAGWRLGRGGGVASKARVGRSVPQPYNLGQIKQNTNYTSGPSDSVCGGGLDKK